MFLAVCKNMDKHILQNLDRGLNFTQLYLSERSDGPGCAPQGGGEVGHAGVHGGLQHRGLPVVQDALVRAVGDANHDAAPHHTPVLGHRLVSLHPDKQLMHPVLFHKLCILQHTLSAS